MNSVWSCGPGAGARGEGLYPRRRAIGRQAGRCADGGLKSLHPDVQFEGVGGPDDGRKGLESRFDMSELSIMGLAEILPKYRALKARIRQTADAVLEMQPDVMITIDAPIFPCGWRDW